MMAEQELDPNDFVAVDEVFGDDYNADSITHAWFTIVHTADGMVDEAVLVYNANGQSFLGGTPGTKWAIRLNGGHRYNGQDLPLHDARAPRHVLEELSGTKDLQGVEWADSPWAYFE
jgi:hypothetical protein